LVTLVAALAGAGAAGAEVAEVETDVCVVGGGSGGYSAAIGAARAGADCVLVERLDRLGGTSTAAYVCNWEPGCADALAREIYDRLRKIPNAVAIVRDHNFDRSHGPFGLWLPDPSSTYEATLKRAGNPRSNWRAVVFEPEALHRVVTELLSETGKCRTLLRTTFVEVRTDGPRVECIRAEAEDGTSYRIRARVFVDATGGVHLCRAAGYATMLGPEGKDRFGEAFAPDTPGTTLNAISLCYRIRRSDDPARQPPPDEPAKRWPRSAHVSGLPCGDRIVNPLAMLPGRALIERGYGGSMAQCRRIAQAHWRWLQGYDAFSPYELESLAPMLGIRESYRVVGEYVLAQHDLQAGLEGQSHPDLIAVADHSMDVHGAGSRRVHGELKGPYGVPYRCLVPKGSVNLLVACRGASFSHIAASSCRLSRTMIQLGRAAGTAAAMAVEEDVPVAEIDVAALQERLGVDSVGR
jgi:2-polyprenyl-6-methoxyphenol hydroxylase-like FAD-dependent oxidoreductase